MVKTFFGALAVLVCLSAVAARVDAQRPKNAAANRAVGDTNRHEGVGHEGGGHEAHIGAPIEDSDIGTLNSPTEIKSDLALFTFVVFLLLLAILWKFAWGPIVTALERREQTIANHMAEARRANEEAKALLAEYEQRLAEASAEVRALLEEARRDAEHVKQEILTEAKTGAEAERVRGLHDIEAAADQAMKQLAERSADLAVELAGKIVRAKLTADDHARLIQEAVARFPRGTATRN